MVRKTRPTLDRYPFQVSIATRWIDNDQYGHLNNAVYYHLYDSAINSFMMQTGWNPNKKKETGQIALVVSSGSEYYEITKGFPDPVVIGVGVKKIGHSSVEYELAVYQHDLTAPAKAVGRFVHVFVDRDTEKTRKEGMPDGIRSALNRLLLDQPASKL